MSWLDTDISQGALSGPCQGWSASTLQRRFTLICVPLVVGGLLIIGSWTSAKIDSTIMVHAGYRAAERLEGMMAPLANELAGGGLSNAGIAALRQDLAGTARPLGIVETKVWALDGRVLFASDVDGIARMVPVEGLLASAIGGHLSMAVDKPTGDVAYLSSASPNLMIYVPVRRPTSGEVSAVAGFYQDAAILRGALDTAHWQTWVIMGVVGLALVTVPYSLMAQGSRLIDCQRADLSRHEAERVALMATNVALHDRARHASAQVAEITEGMLRRVGSDIHDGIGQLLTVAQLRLDQLFRDEPDDKDYQSFREIIDEAMTEVRELSSGLSLPRIGEMPIADAIRTMILRHERHTSTEARLTMAPDLAEPGPAVKLAICRFIQEGLGNAFKHAQGRGQSVEAGWAGPMISVTVSDSGPGLPGTGPSSQRPTPGTSLGLVGLKTRVEAVGGAFAISSRQGDWPGTTLRATFPVA